MNRQEIYHEIEQMFGLVPSFFKGIPDSSLETEWNLMKRLHVMEGPIPNKYRELIGVAIAEGMNCRYCSLFHSERARMNGATDAEIEDAIRFAELSSHWNATLNGLQIDYDQFKEEMKKVNEYIQSRQAAEKELYDSYRGSGCCC